MSSKTIRITGRVWWLGAILFALSGVWILGHQPINRAISVPLLLRSEGPREDWFFDLANQFADPTDFLQRCWQTGKVIHRQLVAAYLKEKATAGVPWFRRTTGLLMEATRDGDMSVRELALGIMETINDPRLIDCAQAQLSDPDPLVRQLGLEYLRKAEPARGVPLVMPLLDDADLRVAARAEIALMRWTHEDYGARVRLAIPAPAQSASQGIAAENIEKLRQAIEHRKAWWQAHAQEFPAISTLTSKEPVAFSRQSLSDFTLRDLDGRPVRLSDFKGRTVLLNFWATWCTACLAEVPELIALRKKLGDRVAIIGVALDGVTDEHGHSPSAEGEEENHRGAKSLSDNRKRVRRAVKARGLNYTVLLDPSYSVGVRFNGGELPTTVVIDTSGRLRRRFIGERTREVFESMIAEAERQ